MKRNVYLLKKCPSANRNTVLVFRVISGWIRCIRTTTPQLTCGIPTCGQPFGSDATIHADYTLTTLKHDRKDFIPLSLWPPNSPDLNAVDYKTRMFFSIRFTARKSKNRTSCKSNITEEWECLDQSMIDNAISDVEVCALFSFWKIKCCSTSAVYLTITVFHNDFRRFSVTFITWHQFLLFTLVRVTFWRPCVLVRLTENS